MRLEGWHVMVFLATLVVAAMVVVVVTLVVRWTLRWSQRKDAGGGSGPATWSLPRGWNWPRRSALTTGRAPEA